MIISVTQLDSVKMYILVKSWICQWEIMSIISVMQLASMKMSLLYLLNPESHYLRKAIILRTTRTSRRRRISGRHRSMANAPYAFSPATNILNTNQISIIPQTCARSNKYRVKPIWKQKHTMQVIRNRNVRNTTARNEYPTERQERDADVET